MGTEIERKYLLNPALNGWKKLIRKSNDIKQGYLLTYPSCTIRIRLENANRAIFCIKGKTTGISNPEFEFRVPLFIGRFLYRCCGKRVVTKTRHHVPHGKFLFEVDVFTGKLLGLIMAEVELNNEDETIDLPPWIGKEVSHDSRYKNVVMMRYGIPEQK